MSKWNRLPEDAEERRRALPTRLAWLARQEPEHAARFCSEHVNYVGHRGVFPCADCA